MLATLFTTNTSRKDLFTDTARLMLAGVDTVNSLKECFLRVSTLRRMKDLLARARAHIKYCSSFMRVRAPWRAMPTQ